MRLFRSAAISLISATFICCSTVAVKAHDDDEKLVDLSVGSNGNYVMLTGTSSTATPGAMAGAIVGGVFDASGDAVPIDGGGSVRVEPVVARTWCDKLFRDLVTSHPCFRRFPHKDEPVDEEVDEGAEEEFIDPVSVMVSAVAFASVDGAGLVVSPGRDWVYAGVPTLAHARNGELSTTVNVLGLDVPVTFTGARFVFDFGNGAPPVVSVVPGAPYPDMSIQGTYLTERNGAFVTLTTTWDATVTHPLTGDVMSVPGALRTVERSAPFRVVRSRHRLIAPEEFGKAQ